LHPRADVRAFCKHTWWVFLAGGLAFVGFGLVALFRPRIAPSLFSILFPASLLLDGAFNAAGAWLHREKDGWAIMLAIGVLGLVVAASMLLAWPMGMRSMVYMFALQAIVLGVLLATFGYRVRRASKREWALYMAAALSLSLGVLAVAQPVANRLSHVWLIATWSIVLGVLRIVFAFGAWRIPERYGPRHTP
jgi:uncharacterized membrane protein HdeD (DUF308 family)